MSDNTPEVTPSGPAAPASPAPEGPTYDPKSVTPEEWRKFKETGDWPAASASAKSEKPAESEPATPDTESSGSSEEDKTAPESEPGKDNGERKELTPEERSKRDRDYQQRRHTRQVTHLNRELGQAQARIRQLEEQLQLKPQPESAPGTKDGRPRLEDFDDYEAFRKADELWLRNDERRRFETERETREAEEATQARIDAWDQKVQAWLKRDKARTQDNFESAYTYVDRLLTGSALADEVASFIAESEVGPAVVDYFAEHDEELTALLKKPRRAAIAEFFEIENRLAAPAPPSRKISNAPGPPAQVGGRSVSTKDEAQAALERGDYATFKRIEDARDAERFAKGGR